VSTSDVLVVTGAFGIDTNVYPVGGRLGAEVGAQLAARWICGQRGDAKAPIDRARLDRLER
jgi:hypothetical protein